MSKELFFLDKWNKYLEYLPDNSKDVYFTEEYVKLYENHKHQGECFVYHDSDNSMLLFPYLKGKLPYTEKELYDFESAYGYGGTLTNNADPAFLAQAWGAFCDHALKNGIVCGFIRFHPLLKNYQYFKKGKSTHADLLFERKTIAMDLDLPLDEIWQKEIHPKHRNMIRMAQKSGLRFVADENLDHLSEFMSLYQDRMKSLGADNFYFFPDEYFYQIKERLHQKSFLGIVYLDDRIIAAAIIFYYGPFGHYHLSASVSDFLSYGPNNFLVFQAAQALKERGVKVFH